MRRALLIVFLLLPMLVCVAGPARAEEDTPAKVKKTSKKGGKKPPKAAKGKKKGAKKATVRTAGTSTGKTAYRAEPAPAKSPEVAGATVTEVRYWSNPDYTRVSIALDHETTFEGHQIKPETAGAPPSRIYIDIAGAKVGHGVKDVPIGDGHLKTARVGQFKADVVRVVLDVENLKDYKIFPLSDPFRIVIDVKGERKAEISRLEEKSAIQALPPTVEVRRAEPAHEKPSAAKPAVTKPLGGKIRRIVVDPGHGGHDPGAIGAGGTQEKEVVLAMGLKLAERLRRELGADVVMTRSTDVFIPLEERTAIANKVNADLFVSIHANASLNRSAAGIETYYLNLAKSEKAAQLAARENNTSLEKVSVLQAILFDLMANYKINDSAHLADEVQKAAVKKLGPAFSGIRNNGVKQGPFYVLVGATMPSILVESAFISNEKEEKLLKDPRFQDTVVEGIVEGIRGYAAAARQ
jgi:N-acetylmuramoyl-L-alanine amidase